MDNQLPKPTIVITSLIQGIILTLLYRSVENQQWPATEPLWLTSLATLAISLPLLTLLCITKNNLKQTLKYLLPFTVLLSVLGGYVGYQQEPTEYVNNGVVIAIFIFTALIASFKALMYIQQFIGGEEISYSSLFKLSWRNFIIFGECWIFLGIFWGILQLGAGLFAILEINFFKELLTKDWFVIPVLNLTFGFAIIVFRNIVHTVDNIATILQTLIKFLLPVLTVVSLGFLATLPFTGLAALWKTGAGSLLVMWLQALTLFFVNAVYQDESHQRPYKKVLHKLVFIGVALLPIYSFISAYGIWLRVEQYGLSIDRCWAILVCFLLASFSFGYFYGIIKKRDNWLETLSRVNIVMGMVVLGLVLLINSPVLNFQSISAKSQLNRLTDGKVTYDNFDYQYFDRSLGRQGYLALQQLKAQLKQSHPDKKAMIDRMYINHQNIQKEEKKLASFEALITYWPDKDLFPGSLLNAVFEEETRGEWTNYRSNNYYFIAQDLNGDNQVEYIIIKENNHSTSGYMWSDLSGKWKHEYMPISNPDKNRYLKEFLINDQVGVVEPKWKSLTIGSLTFNAPKD